jgi:CBS domain containing-hemolysin-like protein
MTLLPWLVIGLLIAVNALYVAAEFSAVAVQKSQLAPLAREGNRRAAGLMEILKDGAQLDRYIAACQIGITLSSLVAGAYGQATIALQLGPWIAGAFGLGAAAAQSSAFVAVLLILTTLQVVLGELVPKSLALQFPERTALATYLPTRWSLSLFRGFIWLLNGSGFLLLKPFGIKPGGHQHVHSPEEIQFLLAESQRGGALSPEAHRRLERGLRLSARTVRQMMTPRGELYAIEVTTPAADVMERILESPYSRVPIYQGTLDHVVGAVNTKDVARSFAIQGEVPPLSRMLRPIPFVPETLGAHRFVRMLQEQQSSKAIVVDEFGGVQGIISIEDVLTQLFGDIGDELKQPEPGPERLADGTVRLPGDMELDEAEPWLGARWEGPANTVGGHVVAQLGRLPAAGERLEIDGVSVTVAEMGPTAVRWVVVQLRLDAGEAHGEGSRPGERG